jgi:hypothetical protein
MRRPSLVALRPTASSEESEQKPIDDGYRPSAMRIECGGL